jgi:hypothetical protein
MGIKFAGPGLNSSSLLETEVYVGPSVPVVLFYWMPWCLDCCLICESKIFICFVLPRSFKLFSAIPSYLLALFDDSDELYSTLLPILSGRGCFFFPSVPIMFLTDLMYSSKVYKLTESAYL